MNDHKPQDKRSRNAAALSFRRVEYIFYGAIALALTASGIGLFLYAVYTLLTGLTELPFAALLLDFLDAMLLVFIVTELIHTVRAVIDENVLMTEPFLIVGIVAAIRRLVVISAEVPEFVGKPEFDDLMLEMGILIAAVVGLALSIFMLRHTVHTEPRPAHEADEADDA